MHFFFGKYKYLLLWLFGSLAIVFSLSDGSTVQEPNHPERGRSPTKALIVCFSSIITMLATAFLILSCVLVFEMCSARSRPRHRSIDGDNENGSTVASSDADDSSVNASRIDEKA